MGTGRSRGVWQEEVKGVDLLGVMQYQTLDDRTVSPCVFEQKPVTKLGMFILAADVNEAMLGHFHEPHDLAGETVLFGEKACTSHSSKRA